MFHLPKRMVYALLLVCAGGLSSLPGHAAELSGISAISAGASYTCAITTAGGVKCWGYNRIGQLGDNSTTNRLTPVDVTGLASGVTAITTSYNYSCALTTAGGVKCWGDNRSGQLGDNSRTQHLTPVDVTGLTSGVTAIAAGGGAHTCALTTAGGVKCWGYNGFGQLGDNSTTNRLTPVDVTGLASGVTAIDAGAYHTCALTTAGGVKCWGGGGNLGDNSTTTRLTPVDVTGLASGVMAITAGGRCALTTAGGVKCWGYNGFGQLGDNSTTNRLTPVDVTGLASGVTAIDAGAYHTCALTAAGGVKCWGLNNFGQLGDNSSTQRLTPVDVTGLASGMTAIDVGITHTCALTTASAVKCWGNNDWGMLGDGSTINSSVPVSVITFGAGPGSRLTNLSARGQVQTGENVMIGGFVIGGAGSKKVLIRGLGPTLASFGVSGVLLDPMLQLFSGSTMIASNDNWGSASNATEIDATGLAPGNTLESAILTTLAPGAYTAVLSGVGGGSGVGIAEVYEIDHPESQMTNMSTRGQVQTGDNVMIGGFIISGDAPKTVMIRAVGPTLANYGVTGVLANPTLQLYSGSTVVATNDDWGNATNAAAIYATGLAPVSPQESAILVTLAPGAYTAVVSGVGGGTGVGIIEVFAQ
ncbi:MAG: hypothetical protein Q7T21_01220 [Gallionella sp.]|nr:hypothetical protein [Gallionella sp.]